MRTDLRTILLVTPILLIPLISYAIFPTCAREASKRINSSSEFEWSSGLGFLFKAVGMLLSGGVCLGLVVLLTVTRVGGLVLERNITAWTTGLNLHLKSGCPIDRGPAEFRRAAPKIKLTTQLFHDGKPGGPQQQDSTVGGLVIGSTRLCIAMAKCAQELFKAKEFRSRNGTRSRGRTLTVKLPSRSCSIVKLMSVDRGVYDYNQALSVLDQTLRRSSGACPERSPRNYPRLCTTRPF
jgi:hypothetical protein